MNSKGVQTFLSLSLRFSKGNLERSKILSFLFVLASAKKEGSEGTAKHARLYSKCVQFREKKSVFSIYICIYHNSHEI